ncbi:MAG: MBL fold metallo-hydrolase [Euzebyales bacterium]|jgi:glyoxylase-like metal-dependent hydrolase (beta-lactamase superfamily II)|nr:MBL fold metallo-hydrolase [Euzebyales bacterium]
MAQQYGGHVEPGGRAISRSVDVGGRTVEIRKLSVGPMDNNAYVLADTASGHALLIDAANDAGRLLEEVDGLALDAIVTTHGHRDHWQALAEVADATGAPAWLHPADADMVPRAADRALEDGGEVRFGETAVRLVHTPGHTRGSTCLLLGDAHLFSGDTLFPGGPGNTFGSSEAFARIMESLEQRIFGTLPDETWVYPGHGDDTTLGAERPHLDEWQARGW